jgi:predicted nucleic acid-binding Zn ribbon protein
MSPIAPLPGQPGPGPRPVSDSLDRLATSLGVPSAGVLAALFSAWPELVGAGVAGHSRPRSLRNGVLVVAVDEPAWATQLRWLEADLLARLSEALGEGVVRSVDVRVRRG